MTRHVLFVLLLSFIALTCNGCATILGGIIGHQSGELCAGLAIGAAVDFGDDIVRGVCQVTAREENLQKDFQEKSTFDAAKGEITIPICSFSRQRIACLTEKLQDTFQDNNWTCQRTLKTVKTPWFGPTRWEENWNCTTAESESVQSFVLKINFRSNRDTEIHIKPADCSAEQTAAITSQVHEWLEQSIPGSCNST